MTNQPIKAFSFGGGVQSTAALVLAAQGRIDYRTFLFANVGSDSELPATLRYVRDFAIPFAEAHGLSIVELFRAAQCVPRPVGRHGPAGQGLHPAQVPPHVRDSRLAPGLGPRQDPEATRARERADHADLRRHGAWRRHRQNLGGHVVTEDLREQAQLTQRDALAPVQAGREVLLVAHLVGEATERGFSVRGLRLATRADASRLWARAPKRAKP